MNGPSLRTRNTADPRLPVAVDEHGFRPVRARPTADTGKLSARPKTPVIAERPIRHWRVDIILFQAPAHLGGKALPEGAGAPHHLSRIGVLTLEMPADPRVEGRRIREHRLPVFRFQPDIVVPNPHPVNLDAPWPHLGKRSRWERMARQAVGLHRHPITWHGRARDGSGSGHGACLLRQSRSDPIWTLSTSRSNAHAPCVPRRTRLP